MEEQLSLCVSEYDDNNTLLWRRIGDYIGANRVLYPVQRGSQPELLSTDFVSGPMAVSMISWAFVNGKITASVTASQQPVYEIFTPKEFENVILEDEKAVKGILRKGFTLPLALKNCFQHGDTKLVLSVPSENGDNRGLLLTDTQNWEYIEDGRSFFKVKVFPKPEDGVRALHAIPLVDFYGIGTVSYCYERSTSKPERIFLAQMPRRTGSFCPYDASQYALIFMRRYLDQSKATVALHQDRSLTKRDIACIMDEATKAADSIETVGLVVGVSDSKISKKIGAGIQKYLPTLTQQIQHEDETSKVICETLWENEAIKSLCIDSAKAKFVEEIQQACAEQEKVLADIKADIENQKAIREEYSLLQTRITEAENELAQKQQLIHDAEVQMKTTFQKYNSDFMALASASLGIANHSMPMYVPGEESKDILGEVGRQKKEMESLSKHQWEAEWLKRHHLMVDGVYAAEVANIISLTQENSTAAVVIRADEDICAQDMLESIEKANTHVVLVEGVVGCASDAFTLALLRRTNKRLVLSVDDDRTVDAISNVIKKVAPIVG